MYMYILVHMQVGYTAWDGSSLTHGRYSRTGIEVRDRYRGQILSP
jgi:hypothetical protein